MAQIAELLKEVEEVNKRKETLWQLSTRQKRMMKEQYAPTAVSLSKKETSFTALSSAETRLTPTTVLPNVHTISLARTVTNTHVPTWINGHTKASKVLT